MSSLASPYELISLLLSPHSFCNRRVLGVVHFVAECAEPLFKGTLSGREFAKKLSKTKFLSENLAEDLEENLEDEESNDIEEEVFTQATLLLLILYLFDYLPYALISSPKLTINFKFNGMTLICEGTDDLMYFNHETAEKRLISLMTIIPELQRILQRSFPPLHFVDLIHPTLCQIAIVISQPSWRHTHPFTLSST
jgi:hypothetical protein